MASEGKKAAPTTGLEQLKHQTWVLRVSIDCEGCKRKVKKALQGIEGVYTTAVDAPLHTVTVTGIVDSEVLIKKLHKVGKHAEILPPENPPSAKEGEAAGSENGKSPEKEPPSSGEGPAVAGEEEAKSPEKKEEAANGDVQKPSANTGVRRKGKKKGRKDDSVHGAEELNLSPGATTCSSGVAAPPCEQSHIGKLFPHFPQYPAPPPPLYAVSYSTAHPNAGYGAVFYAAPPHSFVFAPHPLHHHAENSFHPLPLPPAELVIPTPGEAPYHAFSEENPNACCVM